MYWIAIGLVVAAVGGLVFWIIRRRRRTRLISFVALLREPVSFDPAVLASVAGRAWNADLGNGEEPGADGFVVGADIMNTIMYDGRLFLINSFPRPYLENVEEVAGQISDLRIRAPFLEHQAWFSCDAMGVDGTTPKAEVKEWYQLLGKLFAELLDDNCLLIYLPDTSLAYPVNEDSDQALRSHDPIGALQESLTLPIIQVSPDDPRMKQAVEKARQEWPRFVAAYEAQSGETFSVKAPITHGDNTEFIWISVTAIEGDRIYGELGNDPGDLGPLRLGSKVSVLLSDLNDWCFIDPQGNLCGGFTIEAVQKASRESRKK